MSQAPFSNEEEARFKVLENQSVGQFNVVASTEVSTANGGALDPNKFLSQISSAGAETRTLAAPPADGILKEITMTVHGGDTTIALTNFTTGTTATFSAVGQSLIAMSAGGKWVRLGGSAAIT